MIDSNDCATIDLFPVKRSRGRPATGSAKSSAQRQADYRARKLCSADLGCSYLQMWVDTRAKLALDRLAFHDGISAQRVLERLIIEADDKILSNLDMDSPAWHNYLDKK
jgi:hypothetical protein